MKVTSSYKVKLVNINNCLDDTIDIYRSALSFYIEIINKEWSVFDDLTQKERVNLAEKLTHKTKDNPEPPYNFGDKFYKYPSYLRRSTISDAIGVVSSYRSNLKNYELEKYQTISSGKKFNKKPPRLNLKHFKCPALYKGNMFLPLPDDKDMVLIKIYKINKVDIANESKTPLLKNNKKTGDWVWQAVKLRYQDLKYINKNTQDCKELSPTLIKKGCKFYLQFGYEKNVTLNDTKFKDKKILAVDLGVNQSAVCSVMLSNGTVTDRLFINQPVEKDRMYTLLNRLRLKQKQGSRTKKPKIWGKINGLNNHIVNDTVSKIINFTLGHQVDTIVFEYLSFSGKKHKNNAAKLQMWAKNTIIKKVGHKAHTLGMRYSRVCAKNTSALAFDGSGKVKRDKNNHSLCRFASGKQYNCDLNASYNIGARYFIRELQKTTSEKKWLQVVAKVPELARRTQCTLSTLKLAVA